MVCTTSEIISAFENEQKSTVFSALSEYLSTGLFVDLSLVCKGQVLRAHKVVLASSSKYFRDFFRHQPGVNIIDLDKELAPNDLSLTLEDVQLIIGILYCVGTVEISPQRIEMLLVCAQVLGIPTLISFLKRIRHSIAAGKITKEPPLPAPPPPPVILAAAAAPPLEYHHHHHHHRHHPLHHHLASPPPPAPKILVPPSRSFTAAAILPAQQRRSSGEMLYLLSPPQQRVQFSQAGYPLGSPASMAASSTSSSHQLRQEKSIPSTSSTALRQGENQNFPMMDLSLVKPMTESCVNSPEPEAAVSLGPELRLPEDNTTTSSPQPTHLSAPGALSNEQMPPPEQSLSESEQTSAQFSGQSDPRHHAHHGGVKDSMLACRSSSNKGQADRSASANSLSRTTSDIRLLSRDSAASAYSAFSLQGLQSPPLRLKSTDTVRGCSRAAAAAAASSVHGGPPGRLGSVLLDSLDQNLLLHLSSLQANQLEDLENVLLPHLTVDPRAASASLVVSPTPVRSSLNIETPLSQGSDSRAVSREATYVKQKAITPVESPGCSRAQVADSLAAEKEEELSSSNSPLEEEEVEEEGGRRSRSAALVLPMDDLSSPLYDDTRSESADDNQAGPLQSAGQAFTMWPPAGDGYFTYAADSVYRTSGEDRSSAEPANQTSRLQLLTSSDTQFRRPAASKSVRSAAELGESPDRENSNRCASVPVSSSSARPEQRRRSLHRQPSGDNRPANARPLSPFCVTSAKGGSETSLPWSGSRTAATATATTPPTSLRLRPTTTAEEILRVGTPVRLTPRGGLIKLSPLKNLLSANTRQQEIAAAAISSSYPAEENDGKNEEGGRVDGDAQQNRDAGQPNHRHHYGAENHMPYQEDGYQYQEQQGEPQCLPTQQDLEEDASYHQYPAHSGRQHQEIYSDPQQGGVVEPDHHRPQLLKEVCRKHHVRSQQEDVGHQQQNESHLEHQDNGQVHHHHLQDDAIRHHQDDDQHRSEADDYPHHQDQQSQTAEDLSRGMLISQQMQFCIPGVPQALTLNFYAEALQEMKNAAMRQLHHQQQGQRSIEEAGSDETDGSANTNPPPESATEESSEGIDQYSEISSSKAAPSACLSTGGEHDDDDAAWLSVPGTFSKPLRRGKLLKKRQNLRQKLKSNLQRTGTPLAQTTATAAVADQSAVAVKEHLCTICGKSLATASLLRKHARFHIERCIIPCAHCPALFERQWQYESHLVAGHGLVEQHGCPDCQRVFTHRSQLLGHMQTSHKKETSLSCWICNNDFTSRHLLKTHITTWHPTEKFVSCPTCAQLFQTEEARESHECPGAEISNRAIVCRQHDRPVRFTSKSALEAHLKVHHAGQKLSDFQVSCNVCQKSFLLRKNLIKHMKNIHQISHVRPFQSATSASIAATPATTYRSSCCSKTFYYKSDMVNHEAMHRQQQERSHACQQCDKAYSTAKSLRKHRQQVHLRSLESCTCNICHKVLSSQVKLRAHRLTHSSHRPFSCHQCDQRFKEKRNLVKHLKLKHQVATTAAGQATASSPAATPGAQQEAAQPDSTDRQFEAA